VEKYPAVIILAGGQSERFWPLGDKNLFSFLGQTLLEFQLKTLRQIGFRDFIVVANKNIDWWLKEHFYDVPKLEYVLQNNNLKGMGGAVLSAKQKILAKPGRPLYILNCDDVYHPDLHRKILKHYQREKADGYLAGYRVSSYQPLGYFIENEGVIQGIIEKPPSAKMPSHWANLVAHLFVNPVDFIHELEVENNKSIKTDDLYERALGKLCQKKVFRLVSYRDEWKILKYPWQVLDVADYLLSQISFKVSKDVRIAENASIEGKVIIEKGVKILGGTKIVGPSFIGANSIIGNNCLIRESMIGRNCVVGFSTEITRSYLGDDCWLHSNYIGDSVLEKDVSLGSGAVTANLRLDEANIFAQVKEKKVDTQRNKLGVIIGKGARLGVNSSIMPGVKIGKNSIVGPGVVLLKDIPENQMCFAKQVLEMKSHPYTPHAEIRAQFKRALKKGN